MKVLITGASGFVGRVLCAEAAVAGHKVRAALRRDVQIGGADECVRVADLGPDCDWREALAGVDVVVHLAARVHVMKEKAGDPLSEFRRVNTAGTLHLAEQAAQAGVKRFVFVSSIKAQGEASPPGQALRESDVAAPLDAYGISKREAELGLQALSERSGMAVSVLRPVLVYGPGAGGNFARLAKLIRRGVPLPFGASNNRRSLVSVWNLCALILRCIEKPLPGYELFLACDDEAVSTPQLCEGMARAMGCQLRSVSIAPTLMLAIGRLVGVGAEVQRLCGDLQVSNARAQQRLGWRPALSLQEGLARSLSVTSDKKS